MSNGETPKTGLDRDALIRGFSVVIDESEAPRHFVPTLAAEVDENLSGSAEDIIEYYDSISGPTATPGAYALDPEISGRGGAAFLWEDVLSVGDAFEILAPVLKGLPPDEAARAILGLALFWRRLRGVRVMLDEQEFLVLRAVKRGSRTIDAIAEQTGLSTSVVRAIVEELKARMYRNDIPLVEGEDGNLTTQF